MSHVRLGFLVAAAGWSLAVMASSANDDKAPPLDDARIKAVVAYFAQNGVKLQKEDKGNYWVVTEPKGEGYEVIVAWRTFSAKATEQEMYDELKRINLAFMLNTPARVAMSVPGLRATEPGKRPPQLDRVPLVAKLQQLFKAYRPAEAKK